MTEYVYYYSEEAIVFSDLDEAREYFAENIFYGCDDDFTFRNFLEENYSPLELFRMKDDDKTDVICEYEASLFDDWVYEELVKCELYSND